MNTYLLRLLFNRSFWLAFFLLFVTMSFTVGLGDAIQGGVTWLLTPIAVTGALTSFAFAKSRMKGWKAGGLIALLGVSGIIFHIAHLSPPFVELVKSLIIFRLEIISWVRERIVLPDFTILIEPLTDLGNRTAILLTRTWLWMEGLRRGGLMSDPVAQAFAWSLVVFLLSAWAGWVLGRYRNPLVAFTPVLAILALIADYTGTGFISLWLMLAGTLLLMGLARYDADRVRWQRTGVDFSESIPVDTGTAIILISFALAALAWVIPSFSVKAMVETIRDWGNDQNKFAESFGLKPALPAPSRFTPYIAPQGLPRSHLLGSGPELNNIIVMTIRTGEIPPQPPYLNPPAAPRHYWREVTYDRYTGTGWVSSPVEVNPYKANKLLLDINPGSYQLIEQEVKFYEDLGGQLNWTGYLVSVDQPYEVAWRSHTVSPTSSDPFGDMDMLGAISPVKSFKATSLEARVSADQLRAAVSTYPAWMAKYLDLPKTTPDRVLALARELTANATTPFDRAQAIETYLRTTYPYTLDISGPPPGRDVADYFLFDLKKGYCDYYATAMVVLARAAGLPARFVSGYASGSYDSENAQYIVTEANAHSWPEIYFPGIGWVEFEPTTGLPPINRQEQSSYLTLPTVPVEIEKETSFVMLVRTVKSLIEKVAFGFFIILLTIVGAIMFESWWLTRQPVHISMTRIFRRMERLGNLVTGSTSVETPFEFSGRLASALDSISQKGWQSSIIRPAIKEAELIIGLYVRVSFSQHPLSKTGVTKAIRAWRSLQLRLLFADLHKGATGKKRKIHPKK